MGDMFSQISCLLNVGKDWRLPANSEHSVSILRIADLWRELLTRLFVDLSSVAFLGLGHPRCSLVPSRLWERLLFLLVAFLAGSLTGSLTTDLRLLRSRCSFTARGWFFPPGAVCMCMAVFLTTARAERAEMCTEAGT